ncbi:stage III sporulation protein SpoIIIAB [Oceanobacillus sp. CAU 1775]
MKWIGALILITATTCIGLYLSNRLEKRPKHIRDFENALQILEAEITYSQASLQDAFHTLATQLPEPLKQFFSHLHQDMLSGKTDFVTLWDRAVENLANQASYKKNEVEIIKQFGNSLGQHDYTQQQKQIRLTLTHLDRELEVAREEQHKYSKLSKTLGVLSGVFIVLLLI